MLYENNNKIKKFWFNNYTFHLFQCPVNYEIAGDGKATYLFDINATNGAIILKKSLTEDTALSYLVMDKD